MEVLGHDSAREAYRIKAHGLTALVPDGLISERLALTGGRGHQTAYEWLARNAAALERTLLDLREGRPVRPPFDRVDLEEESDVRH
ncbi:hypothetical protein OG2516_03263 [Oceanicola granulosus HTCC2516]|uniref:Uncharacterized protein n=1 Tax=Oceanicola granulosus (strain ATCC BAA-861 / DSM 15982 / KCTC 12143 / HTCC2516) TaxID=314256 RepID=Q2CE73_OCEGH|nr:hypothetical protein [Oceanicola granulosus]EAR50987.1 hypothetical protein OG2516_03263 [Oceanicola granulosus HTCC2516]